MEKDSIIIQVEESCYKKPPKSVLKLEGFNIYVRKKFNWIQRKFWKILFGIEIENLKED